MTHKNKKRLVHLSGIITLGIVYSIQDTNLTSVLVALMIAITLGVFKYSPTFKNT